VNHGPALPAVITECSDVIVWWQT